MVQAGTKDRAELDSVDDLDAVKQHWESETAGTRYSSSTEAVEFYYEALAARYEL